MQYFIIENGQQVGPMTIVQLAERHITSETLVWAEGMPDWQPAWKVGEIRYILEGNHATAENAATATTPPVPPVPPTTPPYESNSAQTDGTQTPEAMRNNQPKKSYKKLWKIIGILVIVILLIFAFTNPSKESHEEAVRTEVSKAVDKATATSDNNYFAQGMRMVAKMIAGNVVEAALDQLFEYHNYVFFSKGTVELNGESHTISYGFLGKVITLNSDDMIKALESDNNVNIDESSDSESSYDDSNNADDQNANVTDDNASDNLDNNADKAEDNVDKAIEDKADKAIDRVADKVGKKVEDKINKKLDEVTDSSTIEKLIDKILSLF